MDSNVPADWGMYYRRCPDCGERWHESEGGHECSGEKPEPDPPEREEATWGKDEDDQWFAERAEKSAYGGAW
jgi:hypothetical protein